jgi:hypothetical protein
MTWGQRRLATAMAALALLVGCSSSGAQRPEPSPAASSPTSDRTAGGAEAARDFRSARGYMGGRVAMRGRTPTMLTSLGGGHGLR